jgi:prevent-host-death family protein
MTTLPLGEARAQLSKLVDSAERTHERFDITRNGRRAAVLLAAEDFDSMRETIEILSDSQAMVELRESEADIAEGRTSSLEAVIVGLRESGRLE